MRITYFMAFLPLLMLGCAQQVAKQDFRPTAASAITLAVLRKAPAPVPSTVDADKCPDCDGKGKVGDGTVMVTCKTCGGTGKIGAMPLVDAGSPPCVNCALGKCDSCDGSCGSCASCVAKSAPVVEETTEVTEEVQGGCSDGSCEVSRFPRLFGRRWR